ncbi:lipoyl protein ligase domain-containing protein [Pseudomonas aeruginosa]
MDEALAAAAPCGLHPGAGRQGGACAVPRRSPVIQVDRGGQVTYHGPGQLVTYLLLDVRRLGLGVRELVSRIEQSLIGLLASHRRAGRGQAGRAGCLRRRGRRSPPSACASAMAVPSSGLALNLDMDLRPFQRINP